MNDRIRNILGYEGTLNVGERVMCLQNNRQQGLFNGMQGVVLDLYTEGKKHFMDFEFDGFIYEGIRYDTTQFGRDSYNFTFDRNLNPFDYAPTITAHKAQGDEWDDVLVLEQRCSKWDHKRWAYTAASRTKRKLYWAV
jgi:exodeoxyribonuclease-5